jgi:hypothetical protein
VAEDGLVGIAVFKWNENVLIHVNNDLIRHSCFVIYSGMGRPRVL